MHPPGHTVVWHLHAQHSHSSTLTLRLCLHPHALARPRYAFCLPFIRGSQPAGRSLQLTSVDPELRGPELRGVGDVWDQGGDREQESQRGPREAHASLKKAHHGCTPHTELHQWQPAWQSLMKPSRSMSLPAMLGMWHLVQTGAPPHTRTITDAGVAAADPACPAPPEPPSPLLWPGLFDMISPAALAVLLEVAPPLVGARPAAAAAPALPGLIDVGPARPCPRRSRLARAVSMRASAPSLVPTQGSNWRPDTRMGSWRGCVCGHGYVQAGAWGCQATCSHGACTGV